MRAGPPTLRRIVLSAVAALIVGLGAVSLITGFSQSFVIRLLQGVAVFGAGAVIVGGTVLLVMVRLAGWEDPESDDEFDALVERAEQLAASSSARTVFSDPFIARPMGVRMASTITASGMCGCLLGVGAPRRDGVVRGGGGYRPNPRTPFSSQPRWWASSWRTVRTTWALSLSGSWPKSRSRVSRKITIRSWK